MGAEGVEMGGEMVAEGIPNALLQSYAICTCSLTQTLLIKQSGASPGF